MRAGFRSREAVGIYAGAKFAGPVLGGFVAFMLVYGAHLGNVPPAYRPLALVVAVLIGFVAPDLHLANAAAKRRQALQKALPGRPRPPGDLRRGRPQPGHGPEPGGGGDGGVGA